MLAGAALATPTLLSLLQACKNETRPEWQPEFLSPEEASFITTLVDALLPKTDTPGALDVKADLFMDKVFARVYDADAQQGVREGIARFNENCRKEFGDVFAELNPSNREAALKRAEAEGGKYNPGVWGTAVGEQEPVSFYRGLKSMAVWAYTSSEEIGKNVLSYDPIPGAYKGCIPLSEVGNKWSL